MFFENVLKYYASNPVNKVKYTLLTDRDARDNKNRAINSIRVNKSYD